MVWKKSVLWNYIQEKRVPKQTKAKMKIIHQRTLIAAPSFSDITCLLLKELQNIYETDDFFYLFPWTVYWIF